MSGGVDSAVAAALLHQQGYRVIGVTLRLYTNPDEQALRSRRSCCGVEDVADARAAARRIGIPHYVLNMEREFGHDVIDRFVSEYAQGRTPNPCLACNERVKFSVLLERALALGADRLATGHYARIAPPGEARPGAAPTSEDASYRLLAGIDAEKDQSYVLYPLDQAALSRTLFPLGGLTKPEVRRIAAGLRLPVADKPDSADICFVPGGDYRALLAARGVASTPGRIVTVEGIEAGRHDGVAGFTVGQRRGLALSAPPADGARRYVTGIDPVANVVTIGTDDQLRSSGLRASAPRWVAGAPPDPAEVLQARVRYHGAAAPAQVVSASPDGFEVRFGRTVRAVAPGQAIVLYRGDEVVGGGTIEASLP